MLDIKFVAKNVDVIKDVLAAREKEFDFMNTSSKMIKKYFFEYESIINFLDDFEGSDLYVVVGCRHERPLDYFLNNHNNK